MPQINYEKIIFDEIPPEYRSLEMDLSEYFALSKALRFVLDDVSTVLFSENEEKEYWEKYSHFGVGKWQKHPREYVKSYKERIRRDIPEMEEVKRYWFNRGRK
tara:strand:- start:243 stop:551 length:309 start_codon:yes stop_codon:yes gene_type:complete